MVEGIRGEDYKGDISIDDIDLIDGTCPPPGNRTANITYNNCLFLS